MKIKKSLHKTARFVRTNKTCALKMPHYSDESTAISSTLKTAKLIIPAIPLFIAILIFMISSISFAYSNESASNIKTIGYHYTIFFFLAFFLSIALVRHKHHKLLSIAFLIAFIYALTDELHQFLVPGRAATISDIFIDTLGISTAIILYSIFLITKIEISKTRNF